MNDVETRLLSQEAARILRAGAAHYTAYVGPPTQWDFMGATQFRLLCTLGLRERHKLLDLGCGSLRAGRFLITYLDEGNYFGIEPNDWLITDAIDRVIGRSLVELKKPSFSSAVDFSATQFGIAFDFILAQSIFSHAGPELVAKALHEFHAALKPNGLVLATFIHPQQAPGAPAEFPGWSYPGITTYTPSRLEQLIKGSGLHGRALPWYHPRQTWYAMARNEGELPKREHDAYLRGAVMRDPEFVESLG